MEVHLHLFHGYLHINVQIWVQCWLRPKKFNSFIKFCIYLFLGTFWGYLCSGEQNFDITKNLLHHLYRKANVILALGDTPTKLWWPPTVESPQTPYIPRSARRGSCASSLWPLRFFDRNLGLQGSHEPKILIVGGLWQVSLFMTSCDQILVTKKFDCSRVA